MVPKGEVRHPPAHSRASPSGRPCPDAPPPDARAPPAHTRPQENAEHFIPYIYLKDGAGSLLGVKEFRADDTAPISASFEVKAGVAKVTPFAHCNLHGTWAGDALDL